MPKFRTVLDRYKALDEDRGSCEAAIKQLRPPAGVLEAERDQRMSVMVLFREMRRLEEDMRRIEELEVLEYTQDVVIDRDAPMSGSNVSQAQLDKIHFDRMQGWGD